MRLYIPPPHACPHTPLLHLILLQIIITYLFICMSVTDILWTQTRDVHKQVRMCTQTRDVHKQEMYTNKRCTQTSSVL